jgi:RNA polymerase sigma factor (TIGR02999 family)
LRHGEGDDRALSDALTAVYGDLQRIARRFMARECPTPTFDEEALVHEAYLRLARQSRTRWRNRKHLFAIAARIMRRILVDRARARQFAKRSALQKVSEPGVEQLTSRERPFDVLALDDALRDLARYDGRLASLIELRYFGGLTNREIAELHGVVPITIARRWRLARAWLHRYLDPEKAP